MWALLPVKHLGRAKSRLAALLTPAQRRALARAMLQDVLRALSRTEGIEGILLVSDDIALALPPYDSPGPPSAPPLEQVAESQLGCSGLNAVLAAAADVLQRRGINDVMVTHADLPLAQAGDFRQLLDHYRGSAVPGRGQLLIVPDRAGSGTNVMLFGLAARPRLHYGPDSCSRHRDSARRLGLTCRLLPSRGLGLDVDAPADLLYLWQQLQAGAGASVGTDASHSARLLCDTAIAQRLAALARGTRGSKTAG